MARLHSKPSPIKSFVDLACGAFGAVMLMAMALIRVTDVSPSKVGGTARVLVQVDTLRFSQDYLSQRLEATLRCNGQTVYAGHTIPGNPKRLKRESGIVDFHIHIEREGNDSRLRFDVRATELTEPQMIEWIVRWKEGESPGKREPLRWWSDQASTTLGGSAISPQAIQESNDQQSRGRLSVGGQPGGRGLRVRIRIDPDARRIAEVIDVEVMP